MKDISFPIYGTKIKGLQASYDLADVKERRSYFEAKAGAEIKKLRRYLEQGTFIVYLLGKKSSGKGTYAKMFQEVVAPDRIAHVSIGDMVRSFDVIVQDPDKKKELVEFLRQKYRGPMPPDEIVRALEQRSTAHLLPSELILALAEREIAKLGRKAIFIDGFPRELDQVSYALFFKALIDYRRDPDVFVLIDVPSAVIDERIRYRRVCPVCQTSRNIKLLPTKFVEYDPIANEYHLLCDNPDCPSNRGSARLGKGARLVAKEGDDKGVAPIRHRLEKDEDLMRRIFQMHGVPKILLRNSVPANEVAAHFDPYELTPEYSYLFDEKKRDIQIISKPWEVTDDDGVKSNSLMPPPVVVALIKQLANTLGL